MLSFGEDEKGELYFLVVAPNGRGHLPVREVTTSKQGCQGANLGTDCTLLEIRQQGCQAR